ncbi:MAG: ABC transporter substrate-binding protein [Chloroflexi bacterium]|nr:ABC transporter substrate-binding protein [Chloroflexota bacterium]MCL5075182.1 ABC transporter substrate-binding protein [Chloroflexota bacterium]
MEEVDRLQGLFSQGKISRREFIVRAAALGLSVSSIAAFLSACAPPPAAPTPTPVPPKAPTPTTVPAPRAGGALVIAKEAEAVGFDAHTSIGFSAREIIEHLYSGLVRLDEGNKVIPDLAESWDTSPDGLNYTFHLRKGAKFHNGREVTAEDVIYSIDRIRDPALKSYYTSRFDLVSKYEATDKYTVRFTLKEPYAPFLGFLAGGVGGTQPMVVAHEVVKQYGNLLEHDGGAGPFMLSEFVRDNFTKLVKFKDYFEKGLPYLDGLTFQIMPDETSRIAAVRTGRAQLTLARLPESVAAVKGDPSVVLIEQMAGNYYALGINCARSPFDKQEVREALSWAIDRQEIIAGAVGGRATLLGPIPPAYAEWSLPADAYPSYKRNVAKAKELLAKAGYPAGFKTTIMASQQYPLQVANAQIIQRQLKEVGIEAEIVLTEWAQYIKNWRARDFNLFSALDSLSPEPGELAHHYASWGPANVYGLKSPEADALMRKGQTTVDPAERKKIYNELQKVLVQQAPKLWLYSPPVVEIASPKLKGYKPLALEWRLLLRKAWLEA